MVAAQGWLLGGGERLVQTHFSEKSKLPSPWMFVQVLFWMSLSPPKEQQPPIMTFREALGTDGFALRRS